MMRSAGHVTRLLKMRKPYKILGGRMKSGDHSELLGVNKKITLKLIRSNLSRNEKKYILDDVSWFTPSLARKLKQYLESRHTVGHIKTYLILEYHRKVIKIYFNILHFSYTAPIKFHNHA
jgi:hypothetical protein